MSIATTALKRIAGILDEGSFAEIGGGMAVSGIVTGFGSIGSRPVYVFSQDPEVAGGAMGVSQAEKIIRLYKLAIKSQTPILGLIDSAGVKLEEGAAALDAFGQIFRMQAKAKGLIPQVFAVYGKCGGSMAISAGMSDFLYMTENGKIFVNPAAAREFTGSRKDIGKALEENPASVRLCTKTATEEEIAQAIRTLYDFLPLSDLDRPQMKDADDLNRLCNGMETLAGDPVKLITMLADDGKYAPVHVCKNHSFGFIRLGGSVCCVIANAGNPLAARAMQRFTKFVDFAGDYGLPLVTLTNSDGFSGKEGQEEILPQSGAAYARALALAPVAKVNVITGKASGSLFTLMNSRALGADFVYAWDSADFGLMNAEAAARILYADEIAGAENGKAVLAEKAAAFEAACGRESFVAGGFVDKIIRPCDTRKYLIGALQMLADKAEF